MNYYTRLKKGMTMTFLNTYQWEIFITLEVASWLCLLLFGLLRYVFDKRQMSIAFIVSFIVLIALEGLVGLLIYQETGVISNFQIIVLIFVAYAATFGISDFKKLDRWMRKHIGKWRGVELLTDKDISIMEKQKDPKYIAKKYRISSIIHLIVFAVAQFTLWTYGTDSVETMVAYAKDLSWIGLEDASQTPYPNETLYGLSLVWGIVFVIDFIYSWSYTIFPAKEKE